MDDSPVVKRKLHGKRAGLALDIDETLSWTVGYWFEILRGKIGNPENLTTQELVDKYRYSQRVPYWQTDEARKIMDAYVNSDEVQELLPLIENADSAIREIHTIVPIVAYVTTRPESVINGTRKWLNKHNFPLADIIARPLNVQPEDGNKWKAAVLESRYPEITGIIDDNPALVDNLSGNYRGVVYLYNMTNYSRPDITVIPCAKWADVIKAIKDTKRTT